MILKMTGLIVVIFSVACSAKLSRSEVKVSTPDERPDYSNLDNWAAHRFKTDPSDSVPQQFRNNAVTDTSIDIFFIHPTTYLQKDLLNNDTTVGFPGNLWNADVASPSINKKTDNSSILFQASIFNGAGQVFAPRYRQANYYAYFTNDKLNAAKALELAYSDVKAAFEYYLANLNYGKPIIIASHSQGATHAKKLLKDYFENKPLMTQLVVAYLVGMPVEKNYFTSIPVCVSPEQTGCFCSWRTLREGYLTSYMKAETKGVWVTNPLSWDTSATYVGPEKNKGAVLLNFDKVISATAGGRIKGNVLWIDKPKFFGSFLLRQKNYHIGDLNLFYVNVRENVNLRAKAFLKK